METPTFILDHPGTMEYINFALTTVCLGLVAYMNMALGKSRSDMKLHISQMEMRLTESFGNKIDGIKSEVAEINRVISVLTSEHQHNHPTGRDN